MLTGVLELISYLDVLPIIRIRSRADMLSNLLWYRRNIENRPIYNISMNCKPIPDAPVCLLMFFYWKTRLCFYLCCTSNEWLSKNVIASSYLPCDMMKFIWELSKPVRDVVNTLYCIRWNDLHITGVNQGHWNNINKHK